jgi:monofunctional biosynthetic peptidoglycan transglycosylase
MARRRARLHAALSLGAVGEGRSGTADRTVAAEDQKFPHHHGFDVQAIQDAMDEADEGERLRGASTITQQTAKNLFLWGGRSFVRKGLEAYFTVLLELEWPKRRILEVYLNIAEFGDGVYGAEAAANQFFHKPASQLSAHEAALLASVLPNPKKLHAERPSPYVQRHSEWIERQVRQLGGTAYLPR